MREKREREREREREKERKTREKKENIWWIKRDKLKDEHYEIEKVRREWTRKGKPRENGRGQQSKREREREREITFVLFLVQHEI